MNEETFSKIIKLLEARIVKLEKANAEKDEVISELKDQIAFLLKENKRLVGELRKYSNENTPSGSIPPYLKLAVKREVEEANKEPKPEEKINPRNNRPEVHDRERDVTLKNCPHCGGTRLRKKKLIPEPRFTSGFRALRVFSTKSTFISAWTVEKKPLQNYLMRYHTLSLI